MKTIFRNYRGPEMIPLVSLLDKHGFWPRKTCAVTFNAKVEGAVRDFQSTALGPDKQPLKPDGIVGDATWWALRNYRGEAQTLGLEDSRIPSGLSPTRHRIIAEYLKLRDAGVRERPMGSNRSKEIDKLFPQWLRNKLEGTKNKGPAWCCFCFMTCYFRAVGGWLFGWNVGSCAKAAELARECGIWVTENPVPGDAAVILHPDGTGHIGVVYRVSVTGKVLNTIEGNVSHRVAIRRRATSEFAGFIRVTGELSPAFERGLVNAKAAVGESTR